VPNLVPSEGDWLNTFHVIVCEVSDRRGDQISTTERRVALVAGSQLACARPIRDGIRSAPEAC